MVEERRRVAYVYSSPKGIGGGVSKKIAGQSQIWQSEGVDTQCFILSPRTQHSEEESHGLFSKVFPVNLPLLSRHRHLHRFLPFPDLAEQISHFDPDLIYLRYECFKPFMLSLFSLKIPIVLELNTIDTVEYQLLSKESLFHFALSYYNKFTRSIIFRRVRKIVSVTHEIKDHPSVKSFHKPTGVYPNSINVTSLPRLKIGSRNEKPVILFMATSFYPWHGLDELISFAKETPELNFKVIGNTETTSNIPANLTFTGFLHGEALDKEVVSCDIAFASLSLYKNGLNEACTLKMRDYIRYGFPIVTTHKDRALDGYKHHLQLPNRANSLLMHKEIVVDFCYDKARIICDDESRLDPISSEIIESKRVQFCLQ